MNSFVTHAVIALALICIFCMQLFSQEPLRAAELRYAVMEFVGTSEFPHANQPTPGPGFGDDSPAAIVGEGTSKSSTRYVLIADSQDRSLQVFFDMSLWKFGSGLDPLKSLWNLKDDDVTNESSWNRPVPAELIWSIKTGSLFADLFELPVDGQIDTLVGKIVEQCSSPQLGTSANTSSGTVQRQRVVQEQGNLLILNESNFGQIVKSVRAERTSDSPNRFRCKAIIHMNEKPIEIMEGVLSLSRTAEIPAAVAAWKSSHQVLNASGSSPVAAIASASSAASASASGSGKKLPARTQDRTGLFALASAIALFSVLFGSYFLTRKKRNQL